MQAKQDEYNYNPKLQESRVPPEYGFPPEFFPAGAEDSVPSEDTIPTEFNDHPTKRRPEKSGDSQRHARVKRLFLLPVASVLAVVSIVCAAFETDPLGSDFLMQSGGFSSPTQTTPLGTSGNQPNTQMPTDRREPITEPDLDGEVTRYYHVTYQPTGEAYHNAELTDESAYEDMMNWVRSVGGDADEMVLYDYKVTSAGQRLSDDAVYIGDEDHLEDAIFISGVLIDLYRVDLYYEAYPSSQEIPEYTDSFPTLPNLEPDFAGEYAWSGMGSEEYIRLYDPAFASGSPYIHAGTAYTSGNVLPWIVEEQDVQGVSYDRSTNTLTLDNYSGDVTLDVNLMGNGFSIHLIGENHLSQVRIWGAMYGGSLTLTGDGSLTLNKSGTEEAGLVLEAEQSESCLMIDRQVTLEVYGDPAVIIRSTQMEKAIYALEPITVTGGTPANGAFAAYTDFVTDENGNILFDDDGNPITQTINVHDLSESLGIPLYDYSVVDEAGRPSRHVVFSPKE